MILESLNRRNVADDKLWEMVKRANHLTQGGYESWDDNAPVLVPLMERILVLARQQEDWQVYFYDMAKLFWYIQRTAVNNIPLSFKISEMFHHDFEQRLGESVGRFAREWRVDLAAKILSFYCEFPQIDDGKIARMLEIFRQCEARYGSDWNYGDYPSVMDLALLNRDKELAKEAADKLKKVTFSDHCFCYVCTYARPMVGYYILCGQLEEAKELVSRVCRQSIPVRYRWCFDQCLQAGEEDVKDTALMHCLELGESEMFGKLFDEWRPLYKKPKQEKADDTFNVLFHALAGDWSQREERLLLAEQDDRDWRGQKETPLSSMYWLLCWYVYFKMMDGNGEGSVRLLLGEDSENSRREYSCCEASKYFEQQADLLGAQMGRARKQFVYEDVKKSFEECLKYRSLS